MIKLAKDKISFATHFAGAILGSIATIFLVTAPFANGNATAYTVIAAATYGLSLVALYSASAVYHFQNGSEKLCRILRKLDHSMIYVLIAGTYTPICMLVFSQPKGLYFTIAMWAMAAVGTIFSVCWITCPRIITVSIYLLMGWAIAWDLGSIASLPVAAIVFLVLGGVFYSVGAVIYWLKKPNISKAFGFHELFHVFVLLGSVMHFIMIYFYIILK